MGTVHQFPRRAATNIQLSAYPQDDGARLYCVEVLFADDTWEIIHHTGNLDKGWRLAAEEAVSRRVPLLPKSIFPGRAA